MTANFDIFRSPKSRLNRAKGYIDELKGKIEAFLCTKPYPFIIKPDPYHIFKFDFIRPIPESFEPIAADVIDNLRSVLDQSWYAIAVASGAIGTNKKTYFPFADSELQFEKKIDSGFKIFSPDLVTLLRSFQPYKGGNDLLWALNRECNRNKHTINCKVRPMTSGGYRYIGKSGEENYVTSDPIWDNRNNEVIVNITGPETTAEYHIIFYFFEAFCKVDFMAGEPVLTVLGYLARIVENILEALEGTAQTLSFI